MQKHPEQGVPDGEVVGNVQRITLCNQGLNPCLFTGRFFINTITSLNYYLDQLLATMVRLMYSHRALSIAVKTIGLKWCALGSGSVL